MKIDAIILARGGSKGIPKKNIKIFCGKPLIAWTIEQVVSSKSINAVWVSSDSKEILNISSEYGARSIIRPVTISGDTATSESAWIHAIDEIEKIDGKTDIVIGLQPTSPLRETIDIEKAIKKFISDEYDSMFSGARLEDFFIWEKGQDGKLQSLNYDYKNRKRRQDIMPQYVENGSFYLFKPEIIRNYNNRIGGKIGIAEMEFWKTFEIDSINDWKMCESLMKDFLL